ncbi:MAG: hypothetical protein WKF59_19600 [Chitinophagaceae bacterium]
MNKEENLPAGEDRVPDEEPPQEQPVIEGAKADAAKDEEISPTEPVVETEQLQTINLKPRSENMEVHKHPHHVTHKKKWGEYLLEFFMLFLSRVLRFFGRISVRT